MVGGPLSIEVSNIRGLLKRCCIKIDKAKWGIDVRGRGTDRRDGWKGKVELSVNVRYTIS